MSFEKCPIFVHVFSHNLCKMCEETFYKLEIPFLLWWCVIKDLLNVCGVKRSVISLVCGLNDSKTRPSRCAPESQMLVNGKYFR